MSELQFHNTLTAKKESFVPMKKGEVSLYVCGITPYDESHVGHARCYVVFDVLRRVLEAEGLNVKHIQNYTDVDDKIIDRANKEGKPAVGYAEPFIASFVKWMGLLNVKPAHEYPRVSTHIPEIIEVIKKLEKNGLAYKTADGVYFSVRKYSTYGELSKRKIDDLMEGARVDVNEKKQDGLDFALWKAAKPGEPAWDSPWGSGRPGWHIECSAMSMKYLGEEFDIHGGGLDLVFPHHENELAQSKGATGKPFARTWIHNGFVTVNQEKMSKSLGNFFTLKDILAKFDPMVLRYFLLSQHYRSPLNFSDQELKSAEAAWGKRVLGAHQLALESNKPLKSAAEHLVKFREHLRNDLNTAAALGVMNELVSEIYTNGGGGLKELDVMFELVGLKAPVQEEWGAEILSLVDQREKARLAKQWAESDRLRGELKARGVLLEDTPSGPRLKKL